MCVHMPRIQLFGLWVALGCLPFLVLWPLENTLLLSTWKLACLSLQYRDVTVAHTDSAAFGKATNKALGVTDQATIVLKDWTDKVHCIVLLYITGDYVWKRCIRHIAFENAMD